MCDIALHIAAFLSEVMGLIISLILFYYEYYVWATLNAILFLIALILWIWVDILKICKKSREDLPSIDTIISHVSPHPYPCVYPYSIGLPQQETSVILNSAQPPSYAEVVINNPSQSSAVRLTSVNEDKPPKYEDCVKELPSYSNTVYL